MRVPHTIPTHAFEAFLCSEETQLLPGEQGRTLRAEDRKWDEVGVPAELKTQALHVLARNWINYPILDELPTYIDRDHLLEILPLDLPFDLAITRIPYEHFWERATQSRWKFYDPSEHGGSWRRLYCERHLAEYLEGLDPAYFDTERDECERLLQLVREYVYTLRLRQLVPNRSGMNVIPDNGKTNDDDDEDEETGAPPPPIKQPEIHHIPLDQIICKLPHINAIYINIGLITTDSYDSRDFEFSVEDSLKIGKAAKDLKQLKMFSLTRSNLDRPKAAAILQGLAVNNNITEIDFSHCKLGDEGAHAIGAFLGQRQAGKLYSLKLANNGIGSNGVSGLVRGLLTAENSHTIKRLDLRLNPLGDDGAVHLSALLLRFASIEYLNFSGCSVLPNGGMGMAEVLSSGRTRFTNLEIDCSNNDLGSIVGEAFEIVAKSCIAIIELDIRMCGFLKDSEYSISESVNRNRLRHRKVTVEERLSRSFSRALSRSVSRAVSRTPSRSHSRIASVFGGSCQSSVEDLTWRAPSLVVPSDYKIFQQPHERAYILEPDESEESSEKSQTTSSNKLTASDPLMPVLY